MWITLIDTHHHVGARGTRRLTQCFDLWSWNIDGGFEELFKPWAAGYRGHGPVPVGIAGNEHLGEHHEFCPVRPSFGDEVGRFGDSGLGIEEHGCGLDGSCPKCRIFHGPLTFPVLGNSAKP